MKIIVIFWLLVACLCMAALSQVGNSSMSPSLNCSAVNVSEKVYHWNISKLTLQDIKCGVGYLGNIIYHFGTKCCLSFVAFVHVLQSSWIMSIIITLYYFSIALLACDIFYTIFIKPRFLREERQSVFVCDSGIEDAASSEASSIISIHMLFDLNSPLSLNSGMNSDKYFSCPAVESLSNLSMSHSNGIWDSAICNKRLKSDSFFDARKFDQTCVVRLCKSLPSLSVGTSRGVSGLVINISSVDLSSHSTTGSFKSVYSSRSRLPARDSYDKCAKRSRESHLNSKAHSSQHSMDSHLVPGSITASQSLSNLSMTRSNVVWEGRSMKFKSCSFSVFEATKFEKTSFVRLCKSLLSLNAGPSRGPVMEALNITSIDLSSHSTTSSNSMLNAISLPYPDEAELKRDSVLAPSFSRRASSRASVGSDPGNLLVDEVKTSLCDPCYLINPQKTEVIMSGIPGDLIQDYPIIKRTPSSMIEFGCKPYWKSTRSAEMRKYMSLPNIYQEFGLKNRTALNVQVLESFTSIASHLHQGSSIEGKDDNTSEDNVDSISVVLEKVEEEDHGLHDAESEMEENITRWVSLFREREKIEATKQGTRWVSLLREKEKRDATRQGKRWVKLLREREKREATRQVPSQVTRSSFIDSLKKETYEQVFVPFLFHIGKEIVANMAVSILK